MRSPHPSSLAPAAATHMATNPDCDGLASLPNVDDQTLLAALQAGDEAAFVALVTRYQSLLLRLARLYVANAAVAEEVVQETWLGVLQGITRFEARSSLRTWIVRILINRAKTRGERDSRTVAFSTLDAVYAEDTGPAEDPGQFRMADPWHGHWVAFPQDWQAMPEDCFLAQETRVAIQIAIAALAPRQRAVITLRDVEGWSAAEACHSLGLSETNQRMLLSRARARVRQTLAHYLAKE